MIAEIDDVMTTPFHPSVARGLEHAKGAVARRSDQFVIVLRVSHRHGGRHVQGALRANGSCVPARVRVEIGFDELNF
jgi:hypothetical protein